MTSIFTISYLATNAVSSVVIVAVNKVLFSRVPTPILISSLHFALLSVAIWTCRALGLIKLDRERQKALLPYQLMLSLGFVCYIAGANLSLRYNSPAFVQTFKVLNPPIVALFEYFVRGIRFSAGRWFAMSLLVIGAMLCSSLSLKTNAIGLTVALFGLVSAALYQIGIGYARRRTGAAATELVAGMAPVATVLALVLGLVMEDRRVLVDGAGQNAGWLAASCALSLIVTLSMFFSLSEVSATTFNIVSQTKTAMNYLIGFVLFNEPLVFRNVSGVACSLIGALLWMML